MRWPDKKAGVRRQRGEKHLFVLTFFGYFFVSRQKSTKRKVGNTTLLSEERMVQINTSSAESRGGDSAKKRTRKREKKNFITY